METASSGGSSTIATTTTAIAESTTTSAEPAATKAATKASTSASKTAAAIAAGAHGRAGKTILTDLEHAALPVIAVELLDSVARIFGGLKDDDAGTLGSTVRAEMDIGADYTTCASWAV